MLKKSKAISVIILLLMMFSTVTANADTTIQIIGNGNTVSFTDLSGYSWASDAISSFTSRGIIEGDGNGKFNPGNKVTREQFAKMLVLTFNAPLKNTTQPTFSDVPASRWSNTYVETSKDFLTGYSNPFGGMPTFHPGETATREDIAVALVRMMGLTDKDAQDVNSASYKFSDAGSISSSLLGYVSIAAERNLISGYSDGTFRPQQGISKAEAVVLLNRATKQAVTSLNSDLNVTAKVIKGNDPKNVTLQIETEEGTKVTVDGNAISLSNNGFGSYEGTYPYTFSAEGSKTFTIVGTKAGKTKTLSIAATYQLDAPVLTITYCPSEVSNKNITITGSIYDKNSDTVLTINGSKVDASTKGNTCNWFWPCTLKEGKNTLSFVLTGSSGKTTTQTKTINYSVGGPELTILSCPSQVSDKNVALRGTIYDKDYNTVLSINGTEVGTSSAGYSSSWNWTYELKEGQNTLNFTLTSASGKTSTQTKIINYGVAEPELTISYCPSELKNDSVTIRGSIYDKYYSTVLTINGIEVDSASADYNSNWEKTYTLKEGENTFEFILTSASGKTVTKTKTINYKAEETKVNEQPII
ncbi:MAG: S-layer homology domain-containing protein [Aminipila sp.]